MAGMIGLAELLLDDLSNQRGSPYPGVEACRDGAVVYYIGQDRTLTRTQACGAATPMTFRQTLNAVPVPVLYPERNSAAMHPQGLSDDARSLSFQAQEDALNPQHHLWNPILYGLIEQFFEFSGDLEITVSKYRFHICQQR